MPRKTTVKKEKSATPKKTTPKTGAVTKKTAAKTGVVVKTEPAESKKALVTKNGGISARTNSTTKYMKLSESPNFPFYCSTSGRIRRLIKQNPGRLQRLARLAGSQLTIAVVDLIDTILSEATKIYKDNPKKRIGRNQLKQIFEQSQILKPLNIKILPNLVTRIKHR